MANLSITTVCNRDCAYCFASAVRSAAPGMHMDPPRFEAALDFLARSGIPEARLLGGEPALHPAFGTLVDVVKRRGLRLCVFSNGLMPQDAVAKLREWPAEDVSVLVNTPPPDSEPEPLRRRREAVLRELGSRAQLGFNIDTPAPELDFLLPLVQEFQLARRIRIGLAHPALAGGNRPLRPRHYASAGTALVAFALRAQAAGISLCFDCGFVPCMFPEGAEAALGPAWADVGVRCDPILDVLPDGSVIACYPLEPLARLPLDRHGTADGFRVEFERTQAGLRRLGIKPECEPCPARAAGGCNGGCLAAAMRRLRSNDAGGNGRWR